MPQVIEANVVFMMARRDDPPPAGYSLLVIGAARPKEVTLNHIPHNWSYNAKSIRVKGGLLLKGDYFKLPAKMPAPHEVKRWRWNIPEARQNAVRVGGWKYPGSLFSEGVDALMISSVLTRLEVELRNGQRIYVKVNPKRKPKFDKDIAYSA